MQNHLDDELQGGAASGALMASGPYASHFQLPCLNRAMTGGEKMSKIRR
jgi:hypothetical protein